MKLPIYQVDAFSGTVFGGNPAAVCPLENWIEDALMQKIAAENNLAETAFFVQKGNDFEIRWFTPAVEVPLCGHATLASAKIIFDVLDYHKSEIQFSSKSGLLKVSETEDGLELDFPTYSFENLELNQELKNIFPLAQAAAVVADSWLLLEFENEAQIQNFEPDFLKIAQLSYKNVIITAKGDTVDFVSRFFAPQMGINEDPTTGSAHCFLTPFWAKKLGKDSFHAYQISERKGELWCQLRGDRTLIAGKAVIYLEGSIWI